MSVQRQIDRLIVHRASEWLEVLRTGRTEEYVAFVRWINESPRHMDEFLQLFALSREAREVGRRALIDKVALLAHMSPHVSLLRGADDEPEVPPATNRRWMQRAVALVGTATAAAAAVVCCGRRVGSSPDSFRGGAKASSVVRSESLHGAECNVQSSTI